MATPWKIGSSRITLAPTTTPKVIRSMGRKRSAPPGEIARVRRRGSGRRVGELEVTALDPQQVAEHARAEVGERRLE
jgi:hypothetical protein